MASQKLLEDLILTLSEAGISVNIIILGADDSEPDGAELGKDHIISEGDSLMGGGSGLALNGILQGTSTP